MREAELALTRASVAENQEIFLTGQLGIYRNALDEIARRIARPSPATLFEIDEIIKNALKAAGRHQRA